MFEDFTSLSINQNIFKSHFESRVPRYCQSTQVCNCGRAKVEESEYSETCLSVMKLSSLQKVKSFQKA